MVYSFLNFIKEFSQYYTKEKKMTKKPTVGEVSPKTLAKARSS